MKKHKWNPEPMKKLLEEKGISRLTMSKKTGINYHILCRCFDDDPTNSYSPSFSTLIAMADFFHVSIDELIGRTNCSQEPDCNTINNDIDNENDDEFDENSYPYNIIHKILGNNEAVSEDQLNGYYRAFSALPKKTQFVLSQYYRDGLQFAEISEKLNVSRERARQIREKGERQIRMYYKNTIEDGLSGSLKKQQERVESIEKAYNDKKKEIMEREIKVRLQLKELDLREKRVSTIEKLIIEKLINDYSLTKNDETRDKLYGTVEEILNRVLNESLENMDLSARAYNCLKRAELNTANDVYIHARIYGLLHIRNMGLGTINEVKSKLIEMGYPVDLFDIVHGDVSLRENLETQKNTDSTTDAEINNDVKMQEKEDSGSSVDNDDLYIIKFIDDDDEDPLMENPLNNCRSRRRYLNT